MSPLPFNSASLCFRDGYVQRHCNSRNLLDSCGWLWEKKNFDVFRPSHNEGQSPHKAPCCFLLKVGGKDKSFFIFSAECARQTGDRDEECNPTPASTKSSYPDWLRLLLSHLQIGLYMYNVLYFTHLFYLTENKKARIGYKKTLQNMDNLSPSAADHFELN